MRIESFDAELLKQRQNLAKGRIEENIHAPSDVSRVVECAKRDNKVYGFHSDSVAISPTMSLDEVVAVINLPILAGNDLFDVYKRELNKFNEIRMYLPDNATNKNDADSVYLDLCAREIYVRMPEKRKFLDLNGLKRVKRSLADETSFLNDSFMNREGILRSVELSIKQRERAEENSRKQNPEIYARLDEYEKKVAETMKLFSFRNVFAITQTETFDYYLADSLINDNLLKMCGGEDMCWDKTSKTYTPLGERYRSMNGSTNFAVFDYIESLKTNPEYLQYSKEQEAQGMSFVQTVVNFSKLCDIKRHKENGERELNYNVPKGKPRS